jgi:hypothetical protein
MLNKISERVRFARRRFGRYDVLDCVAVLARLCHQWRANLARFLCGCASVCLSLHGPVWARKLTSSLDTQPLFSCPAR